VGGGIAGQLLTDRLAEKREERSLRCQHLEEIVKAVYAHWEWLEEKFRAVLFRGVEHDRPSPLRKMRAIHALYVPELASEVLAVMNAEEPLLAFMREKTGSERKTSIHSGKNGMTRLTGPHSPYIPSL
jgi:hypothetical protein